jgi:uncharacterized hydrophobic protein (TIGR00341 family)
MGMRLIQVQVPESCRDEVLTVLREEGIDVLQTELAGDGDLLVEFPLPTPGVDGVVERLYEAGLPEDGYTVILNAEGAQTPNYAELESRFVEDAAEGESISNEEVRTKALDMVPGAVSYYAMTALSALVATAGLLLDSPAIVVGSMVIAPLVGASLMASVGLTLGDRAMVRSGVRSQVAGLALVVCAAAAFGLALRTVQFVPPVLDVTVISQISSRTTPGLLSVVVALCAGAAGAFGLATELPVSLVGVAVAAALVPAAAAVGIGVAWGLPTVAVGAFVLLAVNLVSINLAAATVFWALGYRSGDWDLGSGFTAIRSNPGSAVLVLLVVVGIVASGGAIGRHMTFENGADTAVQTVLEEPRYGSLEVVAVRTTFGIPGLPGSPRRVTVQVRRPVDQSYPDLADELARAVRSTTGSRAAVTVEYTERQRSDGEP